MPVMQSLETCLGFETKQYFSVLVSKVTVDTVSALCLLVNIFVSSLFKGMFPALH